MTAGSRQISDAESDLKVNTVCPRSLDPLYSNIQYDTGQNFLKRKYKFELKFDIRWHNP